MYLTYERGRMLSEFNFQHSIEIMNNKYITPQPTTKFGDPPIEHHS